MKITMDYSCRFCSEQWSLIVESDVPPLKSIAVCPRCHRFQEDQAPGYMEWLGWKESPPFLKWVKGWGLGEPGYSFDPKNKEGGILVSYGGHQVFVKKGQSVLWHSETERFVVFDTPGNEEG